jgi:hypothetical protein
MPAQAQTRRSPDEYLAIERQADAKSEYVDGETFAMARVSPTHALIVANLCGELRQALRDRACFVFSTTCGFKVEASGLYCYPDAMVVCGEPRFSDEERDTLLNPALIVSGGAPSPRAMRIRTDHTSSGRGRRRVLASTSASSAAEGGVLRATLPHMRQAL